MKFKKLLIGTMASLAALASVAYASIPLGGSIFPLTYITQPPINLTDAFNEMLALVSQQTVGISTAYSGAMTVPTSGIDTSGVTFSTSIQGNPLMQDSRASTLVSTAGLNSTGTTMLIASEAGRTIYPASVTIMASGTGATATGLAIECSDGTLIASWPVALLTNLNPINSYSSTAVARGSALARGCPVATAVVLSNVGTNITTTTYVDTQVLYTNQ
jgi:hypothetical protein